MSENKLSHPNFENWRLYFFYAAMVLVFLFYTARLFNLQIVDGENYITRAADNRTTTVNVQTQRGMIVDRNNFVLARNVASYNVVITPAYLPGDPAEIEDLNRQGAIQEIYRELSALIGIPVSQGDLEDEETVRLFKPCANALGITEIVYIADSLAPYNPVQIACDIDRDIAMVVQEKASDWPGVGIEIVPIREYPTGWITAEIIGFLGPVPAALEEYYTDLGFVPNRDKVGYAGVEQSMQDYLGGTNGERVVEVDVAGKITRDLAAPVDPLPGYSVKLTIDTRLQVAAKEALIGEIDFWNTYLNEIRSSNGVVVAINPKTGEILALVSYPTYENNRMARFIPGDYYYQLSNDPQRPLFNHAISAEHPPGSVYKLAAAIGALNEGVVTLNQEVLCPSAGKITVIQKFTPNDPGTPQDYVCWSDYGHGLVDFRQAIAFSCDVWFYKVSGGYLDEIPDGLGVYRMAEYSRALGYGQITGIELPGEMDGLVPDPDWKRVNVGENWATGDTYIASMGQGYVLATPLQVLTSFAVLANDGKYMQPTLIKEIMDNEGNVIKSFEPELKWDITVDPKIEIFDENLYRTGEYKVVDPWVVEMAKEGMRLTVTEGTAENIWYQPDIPSAGKTGTAEYCDNVAQSKNLCKPGNWPTHAWYVGYAPYDDPEIVVVAFVYNGGEGSSVAGPIVNKVIDAYFELKAIDAGLDGGG